MSKDKVFIVLTHMNSPKKGVKDQWETTETIEFVDTVRKKHYSSASIIADYINKEIVKGKAIGVTDYAKIEEYVRQKYGPQMKILDKQYRPEDLSVSAAGDQTQVMVGADGAIVVSD